MNKINVLHIIQNSKRGGVQLQLLNLVKTYDRSLIRPTVCCLSYQEDVGRLMEQQGIDFVALNVRRHYRFSPKLIIALYQLMKSRNIQVVRAHKYSAGIYGRIAAWLAGVPVIITSVHGNYRKDLRFERRLVNKLLSRITDRIVAMSESIRQDIIKYDNIDPAKVIVVRNGVDTELFSPAGTAGSIRNELGLGEDETIIGFVGRLVPAKGLAHLIEAFTEVKKQIGGSKLLIVGGGELLEPLSTAVSEKGLKDDVVFAGERSDIPQLLAAMDIFVMPSIAEGLPNALLEAMAAGKPVLVTCAGGMGEIIQDGINGLVVSVNDPAALSEGLRKIAGDRDAAEKMGTAAREGIVKHFSISATARIWEDLYLSLLRGKGIAVAGRMAKIGGTPACCEGNRHLES